MTEQTPKMCAACQAMTAELKEFLDARETPGGHSVLQALFHEAARRGLEKSNNNPDAVIYVFIQELQDAYAPIQKLLDMTPMGQAA
jgi:hypothetical protein